MSVFQSYFFDFTVEHGEVVVRSLLQIYLDLGSYVYLVFITQESECNAKKSPSLELDSYHEPYAIGGSVPLGVNWRIVKKLSGDQW